MLPGFDFLGGPQFIRTAAGAYPAGWAVGVFWTQFGDGKKFCDAMYAAGCRIIRVQGTWDPSHKYGSDFKSRATKNCSEVNAWAKAHPLAQVFYSPFCEHNHSKATMLPFFTQLIQKYNYVTYVNSIWRGEQIPGIVTEVHGDAKPGNEPYIYSFDGVACVDADVEAMKARHSKATLFFFWDARFNGKFEANDPATAPTKRKGWPDKKHIQSIQYLWNARGDVSKFPKDYLWKSHSENKGNGDRRAEKPCLIVPIKVSEIALTDINRTKIATLKRYDPPMTSSPWSQGNRGYRYYVDSWGFELAEKARKKTGSPVCKFVVGKKTFAVNPANRNGSFR